MLFDLAQKKLRGAIAYCWVYALLALAAAFAYARPAYADTWHAGDIVTYEQSDWGTYGSPAAQSLTNNYVDLFAATSGILEIGLQPPSGFKITFDDSFSIINFLPATGPGAPLTASFLDPSSTPAGDFGGDVLALKLNIAFSDAGLLGATSSTRFGDLVLTNLTTLPLLNGMSVRDFLGLDNELLGGGSGVYSLDAVAGLTASLDGCFENGNPSSVAEDNLIAPAAAEPSNVPEPCSMALLAGASAFLAMTDNRRRLFRPFRPRETIRFIRMKFHSATHTRKELGV